MYDYIFLFDNQLIAELENLIKNAKNKLVLISPFIDLDKRIKDALAEKITQQDFKLYVLFGKNEANIYKSIKSDSIDFLKQFPNVEIKYEERLHAKFYQNDFDFIVSSINLYDYSLAKNIEVGIKFNYASKGILGKASDMTDNLITVGVDKVKQDVFGAKKEVNPLEEFQKIYDKAELKYKTEPIIVNKEGLKGLLGSKRLDGFNVVVDNLSKPVVSKTEKTEPKESLNKQEITKDVAEDVVMPAVQEATINFEPGKAVSASQLAKMHKVSLNEINELMQKSGLVNGDTITELGLVKGLQKKNYMGNNYIAYPENLEELKELK